MTKTRGGAMRIVGLGGTALIGAGIAVAAYLWFGIGGDAAPATSEDLQRLTIAPATGEDVARGRRLYAETCAACHGIALEGEPNWREPRADGTLPAPPHDETGHTWHHPDGYLFAYTKFGGQPFMPEGRASAMPGFADRLSDDQIIAVLAYIKSRWSEEVRARQARITEQSAGG